MAVSVKATYANFQEATRAGAFKAIEAYKKGAFKDEVTDSMSTVEIFDILLKSILITGKEKKVLQLGRSLVDSSDMPPALDEVYRRVKLYYSAVTGVFREDGTNFRSPPFQILNEDGALAYIVKGPGASPLYVPGEVPDQYPTLRLEDFPKLDISEPIMLQSKPFEPDSEAPMWVPKPENAFIHPSVILGFPDPTNPCPDELDHHPVLMELVRNVLFKFIPFYKKGAFKYRVKDTMNVTKVFKLLIGSHTTTIAEKDVLRRSIEWIKYLDENFGGSARLSRWHSFLYSAVFADKVFCIFRDDLVPSIGNSGQTEAPQLRLMFQHIGDAASDLVTVGEDWNMVRVPKDFDMGNAKSFTAENGFVGINLPSSNPGAEGEKVKGVDKRKKIFEKIYSSWLGENATRRRTRTGEYSMEEMMDYSRYLKRKLGRNPTPDEMMVDMIGCMLTDRNVLAEIEKNAAKLEATSEE